MARLHRRLGHHVESNRPNVRRLKFGDVIAGSVRSVPLPPPASRKTLAQRESLGVLYVRPECVEIDCSVLEPPRPDGDAPIQELVVVDRALGSASGHGASAALHRGEVLRTDQLGITKVEELNRAIVAHLKGQLKGAVPHLESDASLSVRHDPGWCRYGLFSHVPGHLVRRSHISRGPL